MLLFKFVFIFLNFSIVFALVNYTLPKSELLRKPTFKILLIDTGLGAIIGYKKNVNITNLIDKTINIFYGIKYAKKPKRFKETKLINKLEEVPYPALSFKPHCPIYPNPKKYNPNDTYSEDCLYMNLYTPNLESIKLPNGTCSKKFNILLYIYGTGNSIYKMSPLLDENNQAHHFYSPDLFTALHNTIVITFNYRQEIFSSLILENKFPGSLAIKDQLLAMKWTKKYIKDFCGDENRITLIGHSFGGFFVGMHQLTDEFKKLNINKVIMQSAPFLFQNNLPYSKNEIQINSFHAINSLGCLDLKSEKAKKYLNSIDDELKYKFFKFLDKQETYEKKIRLNDDILKDDNVDLDILNLVKKISNYAVSEDCLLNLSIDQLVNLDKKFKSEKLQFYYNIKTREDEMAYLKYKVFNQLELNPNISILIGTLNDEHGDEFLKYKEKYYIDQYNSPVISKIDAKMIIQESNIGIPTDDKKLLSLLANFYTNETKWKLSNGYYDSIMNLMNDRVYQCPIYFFIKYASMSVNSIYAYKITQKPTRHFKSSVIEYGIEDYSFLNGIHGDELAYLFGAPYRIPNQYSDIERKFTLKFLNLWASFIRDGKMYLSNGNQWPSSNLLNPKYVEINNNFIRERKFEFEKRCSIWSHLLPYKR